MAAALNDDPTASPLPTFHTVFGPIAYHFFPDGCPIHTDKDGLPGESQVLRRIWPVYTQRSIVTAVKATQSLTELRTYATQHGLTADELVAVAFLAVQFLPRALTTVHSPLLETPQPSTKHVSSLIRCLLPRLSEGDDQEQKENDAETISISQAWRLVIHRLVMALSQNPPSQARPSHAALCTAARQCVVRSLTLWIRHSTATLSPGTMAALLQWLSHSAEQADATTARDILRLLWTQYLHVPQAPWPSYRWQQLRMMQQQWIRSSHTAASTKTRTSMAQALADLWELRHHGAATTAPRWTRFPDATWEREFQQRVATARPDWEAGWKDDGGMHPPPKRPRAAPRRNLHPILRHVRSWPENAVGDDSLTFPAEWIGFVSTSEASDVLEDCFFQHLLSLHPGSTAKNTPSLHSLRRVLSMLEHKLHEQWNDSAVSPSHVNRPMTDREKRSCPPNRRKLLRAILALVQTADALSEVIERFMIQTVVPQWEFAYFLDDEDIGYTLLQILTCIEPPLYDPDSGASVDLTSIVGRNGTRLGPVLLYLEQWFGNGTDDFRYTLVSITLTQWICRWLALDWSLEPAKRDDAMEVDIVEQWKMKILHALCLWVDDLLLQGFVSSRGHGIELLQGAAIDFYLSIGNGLIKRDLQSNRNTGVLLGPSTSLLYQIFLSTSVVHMDRVCFLMVLYKDIYQNWKRNFVRSDNTKTEPWMEDETFADGITRIREYNGVIYDFCSLLWTGASFQNPNTATDEVAESPPTSHLLQSLRPSTQACLHEIAAWKPKNRLGSSSVSVSSALSLTHGAAFVEYANDFLKLYYDSSIHTVPVTVFRNDGITSKFSADIIQGALKVQYLEYLKERGLSGIHKFLCTFVRSLASSPSNV